MREYLFRGKRADNGEWAEGYYVALPDAVGMVHMIHIPRSDPDGSNSTYYVDSATVVQYTGLTDRNGRKIFEGDILEGRGYHGMYGRSAVQWDDKNAGFECVRTNDSGDTVRSDFVWLNFNEIEVIGNIYDNPELIGGGSNV